MYPKLRVFHHYIILRSLKISDFLEKGGRILNTYLISLFFSQKLPQTYVPTFLKTWTKQRKIVGVIQIPLMVTFLTDPVFT